jgi:choline dehydrogenase-like flavoprotein
MILETPVQPPAGSFDVILVGTGFASSFFLHRYLARAEPSVRVLVLERGQWHEHAYHLANDAELDAAAKRSMRNRTPEKQWIFRLAFGGCSNCWWACTPRMLPEDFRLRTLYGVGQDWPVTYDELEEYYCHAEDIMAVAGPSDDTPFPRSRPYPQPPHRFSDPDRLLKRRFPDAFFVQPSARPTIPTARGRARCCATGTCQRCPVDAKFTILNELRPLYEEDPRVTLIVGANVESLDVANNTVTGVRYWIGGKEHVARGDLVGLGANAVFNPYIMLRSGMTDAALGRGLVEQHSARVDVLLDGVDNFQGSTSLTGHGYMVYGGVHRRERAAALIESSNTPRLRDERGKWRQRLTLKFIFEDLRQPENKVTVGATDLTQPEVTFRGNSDYLERGMAALEPDLPRLLGALPVTDYNVERIRGSSEAHILGTTVMGTSSADSVVDRSLLHHMVRNLLVLGGSVFPTAAPANPTLTISALSLMAADRLFSTH